MPLATEILGALCAGALIVAVAHQLGLESRRAFGATALVAVSVATVLAVPALRENVSALLSQRKEFSGLSSAEAQNEQGTRYGLNVGFFDWAHEHLHEGETFHLEIGEEPGEEQFEGGGVLQGTVFGWGTYQLGPALNVEQGSEADWIVFYFKNPRGYPEKLGEVITYEPDFAIAKTVHAG